MSKNFIYTKAKHLTFIALITLFLILLNSCGIYKKTDARKVSPNPDERVKQNIEEGRGFRLLGKKNKLVNLILQPQTLYGEHH